MSGSIFCPGDNARLAACLARLAPHLDTEHVALTGGVALELHLADGARPSRRSTIADVDFVARGLDAVAAGVTREFLVSHYHLAGPRVPKGLLQLVDLRTRLRIDIFPDLTNSIENARRQPIAGQSLLVLDASSILAHKIRTIAGATASSPVDPKHWLDAAALADLCGQPVPVPPLHTRPSAYAIDTVHVCARCESSRTPSFPLAPKREIFALLGYV